MMKNILLHIDTLENYTPEQLEEMAGYLGSGRKGLVEKLPSGQNRDQRILASDLLEQELLRLGIRPPEEFSCSESGKPYLSEYPELSFSISHSGNLVGVAVFADAECKLPEGAGVGLDIETLTGRRREPRQLQKLAERFFRPEEIRILEEGLPEGLHFSWEEEDLDETAEEQFRRRFFRIWTFKEAMCKALDWPLLQVMKEVPFTLPDTAVGERDLQSPRRSQSEYLCRTDRESVLTLALPGIPLYPEDICFSGSFVKKGNASEA